MLANLLRDWVEKQGYAAAFAGVGLMEEARSEVQGRRDTGEIDPVFHREYLAALTYLDRNPLKNPLSVILVAIPRPAHILTFRSASGAFDAVLPPTYVRYRRIFDEIRDEVLRILAGTGHTVEVLDAHLKALAARLGLIRFGRNNIGYIAGLGSYFQLVGLVSDAPLDGENESPPRPETALLEKCVKCRACVAACPTGAISGERFLLYAQKCYTLFSESPNPIPESLKPPSPECLIGCLKCQLVCPENKGRLKYEKADVEFSAEGTKALLSLAGGDERGLMLVRDTLRPLGLSEGPRLYARNFKDFLARKA